MSRLRVSVAVLAATAAAVGTTAVTAGTSEAAPRAAEAVLARQRRSVCQFGPRNRRRRRLDAADDRGVAQAR